MDSPNDNAPPPLTDGTHRVSTSGDVEVSTYLGIAQEREQAAVERRSMGESEPLKPEAIAVIDFGSQYSRLIARRVREQNVYCELISATAPRAAVDALDLKGIILSGGPASVYGDGAPMAQPWVFESGVPVLGICYGMQLLAHQLGGSVVPATEREYGFAVVHKNDPSPLFDGLDGETAVWMSHGDRIRRDAAPGSAPLAYSGELARGGDDERRRAVRHPVPPRGGAHAAGRRRCMRNFALEVCGLSRLDWTPAQLRGRGSGARCGRKWASGRVICALSGGVDSAVTAMLVHRGGGRAS